MQCCEKAKDLARRAADPAAEQFDYPVAFDVRELVTLDDVMDEMDLGPNGCAAERGWSRHAAPSLSC